MGEKLRKTEAYRNNEWQVIELKDIKKGERFRLTEPDNITPVKDSCGNTEFIAAADPVFNEKLGVWGVDTS